MRSINVIAALGLLALAGLSQRCLAQSAAEPASSQRVSAAGEPQAIATSLPLAGASGQLSAVAATEPSSSASSQPAAQVGSFTVATFNIGVANSDLKALAAAIGKANADLVAIQEITPQSEKFFRQELARDYPSMDFFHATSGGGLAFLSKVPLKNVKVLPARYGAFATMLAQVQLGGRAVTVGNVHLQPTTSDGTPAANTLASSFTKTEAVRSREIQSIYGSVPKGTPVILLGDFNSLPGLDAPGFLKSKGFVDSYAAANPNASWTPTWRPKGADKNTGSRLDYVFHTAHLKSLAGEVVPSDSSEHGLVSGKLAWVIHKAASGPASEPSVQP